MTRPYDKGYVRVTDRHRLYFERCGNKKGVPVVFLHGGPGSGFVESHKRCFDFSKFNVLFFDQRGAGRSLPFASTHANTTTKLVADINYLLDKFEIERAIFFGGSWGSTLALVYAIRNLPRVLALVLRGIFLANRASTKHYLGGGVAPFAPEIWERFISQVPKEKRGELVEYYYRQMTSSDLKRRRKFCYEWALYELSLLGLKTPELGVEKELADYSFESLAVLEAHYLRKGCFLPENYILENCEKLSRIPVSIVHGRYDLICPPLEAYLLHQRVEGSRLKIVCAGHASTEPAIQKALRAELARVGNLVR